VFPALLPLAVLDAPARLPLAVLLVAAGELAALDV
jgi:hypothetical protein